MTYITKLGENTYEVNGKKVTVDDYSTLKPEEQKYFEKYIKAMKTLHVQKSIYK